jgi:hypothetical protein
MVIRMQRFQPGSSPDLRAGARVRRVAAGLTSTAASGKLHSRSS